MNNKIIMQLQKTSSCSYSKLKLRIYSFHYELSLSLYYLSFNLRKRSALYSTLLFFVLVVPVSGLWIRYTYTSYIYVIHRPRACAKPTALGTGFINIVI